ncbi:ferredoxin FdxA [Pelomonas cellulosilytica]|uniref:Ferredoxin n=1 Tax=Pelomonas cellulosilytica TaxID=2906762 RepID=A0ABS8XVH5_9BURK|nr:ferredoxin FdxA [Pelomonas sp. P8]MCE4555772.1 ferredoxin family protein [Pelomonas sp. P8]
MPFVVTESCIKCKYTDCVNVCPMECFVEGPNFMVIDPAECIDCSVCVPECPVGAIVNANEIPEEQAAFVEINAQLAKDPSWKQITRSRSPLADHEAWVGVPGKLAHLQLNW